MSDIDEYGGGDYGDGDYDGDYGEGDYGGDYGEGDYGEGDYGEGDYGEGDYGGDYGGEDSDDDNKEYDYGDGDIDYDYKEGEPDFVAQFKDKDRIGDNIIGFWAIGPNGKPLRTQTPEARFRLRVDAISRSINDVCDFDIDNNHINFLLQKSQEIPRIRFKNPTAFILGYLATNRGTAEITKKTLSQTWRCYNLIRGKDKDDSIKQPDIIRYARLWKSS